jgi:hypothetical protein
MAVALWGLCLTDAAFAGFRDAAGRDARIFKADFYRAAIRRGLGAGLVVSLMVSVGLTAMVAIAPDPAARFAELLRCAEWLTLVLGSYAAVVLVALGVWAAAEADLRTLASVVVLGPFTLVRPWVIVAAALVAVRAAPSSWAAAAVIGACSLQLAVEPWLGRRWAHRSVTSV